MREFPARQPGGGRLHAGALRRRGTRPSRSSRCCSPSRTTGPSCKGDPRPELFKFAKQAGFTQESFEKCLTDQKLLDDISAVRTRAADTFGVNSTPTFFINGKKMSGGPTLEEFDKAFAPISEELTQDEGAIAGPPDCICV